MPTGQLLARLEEEASVQPVTLSSRAIARTVVSFTVHEQSGGTEYAASRPVITADGELLDAYDMYNKAATIGHEELHALDILDNPLLYLSHRGGISSEMVGYYFSNVMYGLTSQDTEGRAFARQIDTWQVAHLGRGRYVPEDSQLNYLRSLV